MNWTAKWIAAPDAQDKNAEPLFRKHFTIGKTIASARLVASGLAYLVLTLDGNPLSDSVLDPAFTRYDRRVQYLTYDLAALSMGDHVIGARLGRGFFGLHEDTVWRWQDAVWHADPRLIVQLDIVYGDGSSETLGSDESWSTIDGPTRYDDIYGGEIYDARLDLPGWDLPAFVPSGWGAAQVLNSPVDVLVPQEHAPIRVVETIKPVSVQLASNGWVFDLGRNIAGWARLRVSGNRDTQLSIAYDERIDANGNLVSADSTAPKGFNWFVYGRFQSDLYILSGKGIETWEPRYSYKGFRYVQVSGWPGTPTVDDLDGCVVHSDVRTVGSFNCSNDLFNTVHTAVRRTVLNNLHGIPTDCPGFEKGGWMGDAQVMAEANLYNLDLAALYVKWLDDIHDSQPSYGALPAIAPDYGWSFGSGYAQSPPWNAAYFVIPWCLYLYCGDSQPLANHYDGMKSYLDHQIQSGINPSTLSDYMAPGYYGNAPEDTAIYGTAYAYWMTRMLAGVAVLLQKDGSALRAKAKAILAAFNEAYFDYGRSLYRSSPYGSGVGYRQTPNLLALAFRMVPPGCEDAVFANLVADVEQNGLNTGHIGTKYLLAELTQRGEGELAYAVATQRDYPGWGSWVDRGATTCWEYWDEPSDNGTHSRSLDHAFLGGTIDEWFFKYLVGIEPIASGYASVQIKPWLLGGLMRVSGQAPTPNGPLALAWQRFDDCSATFDLTIPPHTLVTFHLPVSDLNGVTVNGQPANAADGVTPGGSAGGRQVLTVSPGRYLFQVPPGAAPCVATRLHLCAVQGDGAVLTHAEHDDTKAAGGGWFPVEDVVKKLEGNLIVQAAATAASGAALHVCISDRASKKVWHSLRTPDKRWQSSWGDVQAQESGRNINGRASAVACSAAVGGDLHVCAIADTGSQPSSGELWHTIRFADGHWQGQWTHVLPDGETSPIEPVSAVACAATAGGDLHVCAIGADGTLSHSIRFAGGNWQPFWGSVQSQEPRGPLLGALASVACALAPNGDLHVCVVSRSGGVHHTIRFAAGGQWQPFWGDVVAAAAGGGFAPPAVEVACALDPRSGTLQIGVTDQPGNFWYARRGADGSWTPLSVPALTLAPVAHVAFCDALVG